VLYSFGYGTNPVAGLTNINGVLYGTAEYGGAGPTCCGVVFKITTSGVETVLHTFESGSDGAFPAAGLTNVDGVLYGTTFGGGDGNSDGTVYKITTSGAETVLYRFAGGSDGSAPAAGLTNVNGALYGTTNQGGPGNHGTVYKITTSGAENVLHSFKGGSDGQYPLAGLTNVGGVLYGTTDGGGVIGCSAEGCGTVYKITTSGAEKVLHGFAGGNDGDAPFAGLTNVNGVLYGTTYLGGANDKGTVYQITTSGAENILHSFAGGGDGSKPDAGLTNVNGVLYGTTVAGGVDGCSNTFPGWKSCGTVFKITTSGAKSVVYRFAGGSDAANPEASLINVNGVLYGTTYRGGACCGTIFSLSL
jgi:uncharacterized repeat protein (TIGR03803 family)